MSDIEQETLDIYERLKELHKASPEEFEKEKERIIEEFISQKVPEEHQAEMRGAQFVIDAEMAKEKDPLSKMNKMVEMFWTQVGELNTALTNPSEIQKKREAKKQEDSKVVLFNSKKKGS